MRRRATALGQRGGAIIMAMLVVTVAAVLVAGAYWRQNVLVRETENELAYAQAKLVLEGAVDWAGVVLAEDARRTAVDHLGEPWAVPLADTRLGDDDTGQALFLSGQIRDAQAKYNLRDLVANGTVIPRELAAFRRLLEIAQVNDALAEPIAQRVLEATTGADGSPPSMLPLTSVDDLASVPGVTADDVESLRPFVDALPQPTPVNANTAPAEVLAARIEGLSLPDARRLTASRERAYFRNPADVLSRLPGLQLSASPAEISVSTQYFSVEGTVTYRRAILHTEALLRRAANRTERVWLRELT